ncbi:transposase [Microcystis aeruginosa FACHB-905 = DIANCHI905]|nr:transposase [Microcystis aeruginosa FACHB-905 = DIANCHI905]
MLTDWKKQEELHFLNEVSCVPLQQGLRHLQTAFTSNSHFETILRCFSDLEIR